MTTTVLSIEGGALAAPPAGAGGVRAYKGIPYAAPPIGPLRWRPPQPVAPWIGMRSAVAFGPNSLQGIVFDDIDPTVCGVSEDCLTLNVWTLASPGGAERLAVMVWIHGGGFVVGSGSEPRYDGTRLAARGIVVVTLNHRLNALGFLAHPELSRESGHGASGNYGMLDVVAALHWVKRNIAAFGGDPDKVTIVGKSAGSEAVSALMASPLAKGLFVRAIGESGAMFATPSRLPGPARKSGGRGDRLHAQSRRGESQGAARGARGSHPRRRAGPRLPADRRRAFSREIAGRDLRFAGTVGRPADGRLEQGRGLQLHPAAGRGGQAPLCGSRARDLWPPEARCAALLSCGIARSRAGVRAGLGRRSHHHPFDLGLDRSAGSDGQSRDLPFPLRQGAAHAAGLVRRARQRVRRRISRRGDPLRLRQSARRFHG